MRRYRENNNIQKTESEPCYRFFLFRTIVSALLFLRKQRQFAQNKVNVCNVSRYIEKYTENAEYTPGVFHFLNAFANAYHLKNQINVSNVCRYLAKYTQRDALLSATPEY